MKNLLFIPILMMLMVSVVSAENLEVTETKLVIRVLQDIDEYLKIEHPLETKEEQQAFVDHIGDTIIYKKHGIEGYGVMLLADTETHVPVAMIIILDMIFGEYAYKYDLDTGERSIL